MNSITHSRFQHDNETGAGQSGLGQPSQGSAAGTAFGAGGFVATENFTVVALTDTEYFETIERLAEASLGRSVIYTWNLDDFRRVCPEPVAGKIRTP